MELQCTSQRARVGFLLLAWGQYSTVVEGRKVSFLLYPIIPESSIKALKIFDINEADINLSSLENNNFLSKVDKINKIDILFKKIEKKDD